MENTVGNTSSNPATATPEAPDRLWVADITYVGSWEGWLYSMFLKRRTRPHAPFLPPHGDCRWVGISEGGA